MNEQNTFSKGQHLILRIDRVAPGGLGMAKMAGLPIEIPYTLPGELVEAEVVWLQEGLVECLPVTILEPSPSRVTPRCQHFGQCGGCKLQHASYAAQTEIKLDWLRAALGHGATVVPFIHAAEPYEYRIKAAFKGRRNREGRRIGYCMHRRFSLVPISECPILVPELQQLVRQFLSDPPDFPKRTADIMVMSGLDGITIHLPGTKAPEVTYLVAPFTYRMTVRNFFQINRFLIIAMVSEVLGDIHGERAVDMYCGVGLYSLFLARRFTRVIGLESNGLSVKYARGNAAAAGLDNLEFHADDVEHMPEELLETCRTADLMVVNPPRAGMSARALEVVVELAPHHLHYVSCNPLSLGRDLETLTASGYQVCRAVALDMFPQTGHVESVIHLERQPSSPAPQH
ncbi:class I SAM-dependent RNA methyltransferase [bacterium]|nr:class I SAM-dependent RNA methyltransferase [candidate division CSSED10-310 bacterium]